MNGAGGEVVVVRRNIVDAYASLDRGWRACILAAVILLVAILATAV